MLSKKKNRNLGEEFLGISMLLITGIQRKEKATCTFGEDVMETIATLSSCDSWNRVWFSAVALVSMSASLHAHVVCYWSLYFIEKHLYTFAYISLLFLKVLAVVCVCKVNVSYT